jgi:hypothetical protein
VRTNQIPFVLVHAMFFVQTLIKGDPLWIFIQGMLLLFSIWLAAGGLE